MRVNSGEYLYYLNGDLTGVREAFQIETQPDGTIRTTSIRDAPGFDTKITVDTEQKDDGFTRAEITFSQKSETRATYEFNDSKLSFSCSQNSSVAERSEITLPEGCIFFPLMRIFQGPTILKVAESGGREPVLVPSIENPDDIAMLLTPTFDERTAEQTGIENDLRIFKYRSKHYDENSRFLLRPDGLLHSYCFRQSENDIWEVKLSITREK
jgi:hypothetical protein